MIYHIVPRADWEAAADADLYMGDTLETEGFIHCSTREQVLEVADTRFPDRQDLLMLKIDPTNLSALVKYEDSGDGRLFPHIYGPIEKDAVLAVFEFPSRPDGTYVWPSES